ncbi:28S ribosomal protein S5, mitochondrial [Pseudolycoriella hygida]|uniref:Small ribosomal subunit protein uS5m n=1 Tax=Pseudolycoriella hygida TaxID=35572 RepID=A0A9Q0RZK2_9DIPT|nr:28S ribosomal protein S5, mitochondrial [Pseudolycoriella hygida]
MASRILFSSSKILNSFSRLSITHQIPSNFRRCDLLNPFSLNNVPSINSVRHTSFFNKLSADQLWKGCTSVSNAGKKRGRARGIGRKKDLNKGQIIGVGKTNIVWPGLNAPIVKGRELVRQQKLPDNPDWEANLRKIRDTMSEFRSLKMNPLERGWTGAKVGGRSIGPPDPIGQNTFEGFDCRVLEMKLVVVMKGTLGRKRRQSAFVVTGNGNGLAGFAVAKSVEGKAALRKAKNRSAQKLVNIELCDGHTVMHDFYCRFGATKITVIKKPRGFGLVCHRAIKTMCEVIGIKDLYAKIEGSTNVQHITKAFFIGLLQQRTPAEIAEQKGLHLVEFRSENGRFPKVIASPTACRESEDIPGNEVMDFKQYMMNDRVIYKRKKYPPFYTKHRSWEIYCRRQEKIRNHDKVKLDMHLHYGEIRSFLTDKYPECRPPSGKAKVVESEAE